MRLRKIINISLVILFCIVGCKDSYAKTKITKKLGYKLKNEIETYIKQQEKDRTIEFKSFSITASKSKKNIVNFRGKYVSKFSLGGKVSGDYNYKEERLGKIFFNRYTVSSKDLEIDGRALSSSGEPLRDTKLKFRPDKSATLGTVVGRARPPFELTTDRKGYFHCKGVPYGRWFVSAIVEQSDGTLKTINLGTVQTGAWDVKLTAKN